MIESLPSLFALLLVAGAAWFFYLQIARERDQARQDLESARQENSRLTADLAAAKAATGAQTENEEARFTALVTKVLDATQQKYTTLAQGSVREVLAPAQEQLAKLNAQVEAIEKLRLQDASAMGTHVRQMIEAAVSSRDTTKQLLNALRASPKARGRWGEQTLKNVLELAGLSNRIDFVEQPSHDTEAGRLRPDVIINLADGRCIVVDSKVALSGYLDAMEASDDAARELHLKKHAAEFKQHVRSLGSKDYWKHVPDTADFVVMFVPGDSFYAAAEERDPDLFEFATKAKVIIVTPGLMVALAKVVALSWRQHDSVKNAQDIADLGRELHTRLVTFSKLLSKVGDSIDSAVRNWNAMVGSAESRLWPQAKRFEELGAVEGESVTQPKLLENTARSLTPPEQLDLLPPQSAKRAR